MKSSALALALALLATFVVACATFDTTEINVIRAHGVPGGIVAKFARNEPLTPAEIISASRHGVPNSYIERQLDVAGVDYLATSEDILRMRRSGVAPQVIDALLSACDRFARRYEAPRYGAGSFWWDSSFYAPAGFYYHCR